MYTILQIYCIHAIQHICVYHTMHMYSIDHVFPQACHLWTCWISAGTSLRSFPTICPPPSLSSTSPTTPWWVWRGTSCRASPACATCAWAGTVWGMGAWTQGPSTWAHWWSWTSPTTSWRRCPRCQPPYSTSTWRPTRSQVREHCCRTVSTPDCIFC